MNKKSFIWLIPVLVMALAMSSCDGDSGGGGLGDTLTFSGEQVYTRGSGGNFTPYAGADRTFSSNAGGTGTITGGKMSITVGIPSLVPMGTYINNIDASMGANIFSYAEWNPADARAADLDFTISLAKGNYSESATSMTEEQVGYTYADRDCTITAAGGNTTINGIPTAVSKINLNLKRGWNAINIKATGTMAGVTLSINTGDLSSCKWILN
jgi:hypothetical protein